MERPRRAFTDLLLVRARIEPDHERPLRVDVVQHGDAQTGPTHEQRFVDAESAGSFVRAWLQGFVRRWEAGCGGASSGTRAIDFPDEADRTDGPKR